VWCSQSQIYQQANFACYIFFAKDKLSKFKIKKKKLNQISFEIIFGLDFGCFNIFFFVNRQTKLGQLSKKKIIYISSPSCIYLSAGLKKSKSFFAEITQAVCDLLNHIDLQAWNYSKSFYWNYTRSVCTFQSQFICRPKHAWVKGPRTLSPWTQWIAVRKYKKLC